MNNQTVVINVAELNARLEAMEKHAASRDEYLARIVEAMDTLNRKMAGMYDSVDMLRGGLRKMAEAARRHEGEVITTLGALTEAVGAQGEELGLVSRGVNTLNAALLSVLDDTTAEDEPDEGEQFEPDDGGDQYGRARDQSKPL
jgi:hypothetical protein